MLARIKYYFKYRLVFKTTYENLGTILLQNTPIGITGLIINKLKVYDKPNVRFLIKVRPSLFKESMNIDIYLNETNLKIYTIQYRNLANE